MKHFPTGHTRKTARNFISNLDFYGKSTSSKNYFTFFPALSSNSSVTVIPALRV